MTAPVSWRHDRNYCLIAQGPLGLLRLKDAVPSASVTTIYKICEQALWRAAETVGELRGSADDARDGFIHFSTAAQLAETAAKHFAGQSGLILVGVDAERLGAELKWERSRGGELFPHVYGVLPLGAVRSARPLPDEVDGRRPLPEIEP
jgi:uncharacterized protein (DUF952 family)